MAILISDEADFRRKIVRRPFHKDKGIGSSERHENSTFMKLITDFQNTRVKTLIKLQGEINKSTITLGISISPSQKLIKHVD